MFPSISEVFGYLDGLKQQKMTVNLSVAVDALIIYFCGYTMSRLAIALTSDVYPQIERLTAMNVAGTTFITAAILSFGTLASQYDFLANVWFCLAVVFLSSFLPALGTLKGVHGHEIISASLIGLCVLATTALMHIPVSRNASLFGAIAGSVAAGYACGTEGINVGIFYGVVFGFFYAIIWSVGLLIMMVFVISILSAMTGVPTHFKRMLLNLSMGIDAVIPYFCGYAMSRFTIFLSNEEYPRVNGPTLMKIISTVFLLTTVLSFIGLLAGSDFHRNMWLLLLIVIFSALLPTLGTFHAVNGNKILCASFVGLCVIIMNCLAQVPVTQTACLLGAVTGCISSGKRCGTTSVGFSILCGIIFGFALALVWALFLLLLVILTTFINYAIYQLIVFNHHVPFT